jgi:hypothetical protein
MAFVPRSVNAAASTSAAAPKSNADFRSLLLSKKA